MNIRSATVLMMLMTAVASSAWAQPHARLAATAPFTSWVGDWKGGGWSLSPTGERTEFQLQESVQERAAGTVLFIEGHGRRTSGTSTGTVSHDGAVLVYRDNHGVLRWNGHEAASGTVEAVITLRDQGFEWSFTPEGTSATVRFIIDVDATHWHEVGELSADGGTTWNRFMEMVLTRQP